MTTDTPRTDAIISAIDMDAAFQGLCRQLEIELSHSLANQLKTQAEVERLREQLASTKLLAVKFWKVLEENGFKIELPK